MAASTSRNWCFTVQIADDDKEPVLPNYDEKRMTFMVVQMEKAPTTGKRHYQGYCNLVRSSRLTVVKKMFPPGTHLEVSRGTAQQNVDYCTKSESRIEGPWVFGKMPEQGKRMDAERLFEAVKSGDDDLALCEKYPGLMLRWYHGVQNWRFLLMQAASKEYREMEVLVLWGPTRTGKTRRAKEELPDAYLLHLSAGAEWWPGYQSETGLIIDDYKSQLPLHRLLQVLDGHQLSLPIKGGHLWALYSQVVITSNSHPMSWYPNATDLEREALMARFTLGIVEMRRPVPEDLMSPLRLSPPALRPGSLTVHRVLTGENGPLTPPIPAVVTPPSLRILRAAQSVDLEEDLSESDWAKRIPPNQQEVIDLTEYKD